MDLDPYIVRANISRYKNLLGGVLDSQFRATIERLLAEELAKQTECRPPKQG